MPKLLLLIGIPGCGKSTRARELIRNHCWARVNKDDLRAMMVPPFEGSLDRYEMERVIVPAQDGVIRSLMRQGLNIVVDDTNLNLNHRKRRQEMVDRFNAQAKPDQETYTYAEEIFTDSYDVKLCMSRVKQRAASGGMNVPEHVIHDMHKAFLHLFPKDKP